MALSLKADHLKRYKDIARLLAKYGRSDLVKGAGLGEFAPEGEAATDRRTRERAERLSHSPDRKAG